MVVAVCFQIVLPVARSIAITSKRCSSSTSPPPRRPPPRPPRPAKPPRPPPPPPGWPPAAASGGGSAAVTASGLRPVGTAVVTKMRSPQMTGLEWPRPSMATFHATFDVSLHFVGAVPVATPVCAGPRQCGHQAAVGAVARGACATSPTETEVSTTAGRNNRRMVLLSSRDARHTQRSSATAPCRHRRYDYARPALYLFPMPGGVRRKPGAKGPGLRTLAP